jgi:hypothetical protein
LKLVTLPMSPFVRGAGRDVTNWVATSRHLFIA